MNDTCPKCMALALELGPNLIGAAASVAVEHGVSTEQMLAEYMAHLHRDEGHDR